MDNWTSASIENVIEQLGYECAGRMRIFWCVPTRTIYQNGLREINRGDNTMTENMLSHVRNGNHFQELYLDHNDSIVSYVSPVIVHSSDDEDLPLVKWGGPLKVDFDDVVHYPVASLPPVISPIRPLMIVPPVVDQENEAEVEVEVPVEQEDEVDDGEVQKTEQSDSEDEGRPEYWPSPPQPGDLHLQFELRGRDKLRRALDMDEADKPGPFDGQEDDSEDDDDYDIPKLYDSDFDLEEDDDLFDTNVDEGKGKAPLDDDGNVSEEDELYLPDSDDDGLKMNFQTFTENDLHNPQFEVGQIFASVELVRKAIKEYSCQQRRDIKLPVNDKTRVCAKCAKGCPW